MKVSETMFRTLLLSVYISSLKNAAEQHQNNIVYCPNHSLLPNMHHKQANKQTNTHISGPALYYIAFIIPINKTASLLTNPSTP